MALHDLATFYVYQLPEISFLHTCGGCVLPEPTYCMEMPKKSVRISLVVLYLISTAYLFSRRINPFDQSPEAMLGGDNTGSAFSSTFVVRFCGSMEVRHDRGNGRFLYD